MNTSDPKKDPATQGSGLLHEADIGSGERTPAQQETDQMIKEIPGLPPVEQTGGDQPGQEQQQQDRKPSQG